MTRPRSLAWAPSLKKKMSEDLAIAVRTSIEPNTAFLAFWYSLPPYSQCPGSSILRVGVISPSSSTAIAVVGLKVDADGYADSVARLSRGASVEFDVR